MRLSHNEIAAHLGHAALPDDFWVTSVVTDSREVTPGALFVCLPGERADGHDFAGMARERGAVALLASRPLPGAGLPVLLVPDTVKALGQIAALWRGRTTARVVAVTGTAGKTTLKETLAQVLSTRGRTARNAMNRNNQIGMPCSVLAAEGNEAFWVMEAGISREGDMDELAPVLRPDLAVILNVGAGHTAGLGKKGVAWHKARLLAHLAPRGLGLVSADYPDLVREARASGAPLRFFSAAGKAVEYRAAYVGPAPENQGAARGIYRLWLNGETCEVLAPFRGEYGAENSIAAAAAAHLLGLSPEEIAEGFARATLPPQRFSQSRLGAWELIDDTYNANPLSMRRMLEAAAEQARGRTFVAVLGEMGELGEAADAMHEQLGRHLARLKPAAVIWKGGHAREMRAGLARGGYGGLYWPVDGVETFISAWKAFLRGARPEQDRGGVLLFKGSRCNRLEELLAALRDCHATAAAQEAQSQRQGESGHVL